MITFLPKDSQKKPITFDMVDYGLDSSGRVDVIEKELSTKFKHLNFKKIGEYYYDFVSYLTLNEFLEFHKINTSKEFKNNDINSFIKKYKGEPELEKVFIKIYEWESGLD
jgi:hypothetical protein